jgi:opacity protein-like surface antigen
MRKFLISAALVTATMAMATPADAQYRGQGYGQVYGSGYSQFRGGGIQRQLAEIRQQIRIGFDRGVLTRGEAERLSRDADHVERRLQRRSWDGLGFREREDLQRRIFELRQRLRFESADRDRRYDRRF